MSFEDHVCAQARKDAEAIMMRYPMRLRTAWRILAEAAEAPWVSAVTPPQEADLDDEIPF